MKKWLILLFVILLSAYTVYARTVSGVKIIGGGVTAGGGGADPFIDTDWSTNSPGADDETCATAGGCPSDTTTWDEWDAENGDTSMAITGGKLVITAADSTASIGVDINNAAGNPLNGQSITEFWAEWKFEYDGAALATSTGQQVVLITDTVDGNQIRIYYYTDGSGDIDGVAVRYFDDGGGGNYTSELAWSPTDNTQYTNRLHWKKGSGADGVISLTIVGVGTTEVTNADNDEAGVINLISLGQVTSFYDGSNTYVFKYDDFKFYTTDPSW